MDGWLDGWMDVQHLLRREEGIWRCCVDGTGFFFLLFFFSLRQGLRVGCAREEFWCW
jgi:hypothetical protein